MCVCFLYEKKTYSIISVILITLSIVAICYPAPYFYIINKVYSWVSVGIGLLLANTFIYKCIFRYSVQVL